jgi:hypothetical protein
MYEISDKEFKNIVRMTNKIKEDMNKCQDEYKEH